MLDEDRYEQAKNYLKDNMECSDSMRRVKEQLDNSSHRQPGYLKKEMESLEELQKKINMRMKQHFSMGMEDLQSEVLKYEHNREKEQQKSAYLDLYGIKNEARTQDSPLPVKEHGGQDYGGMYKPELPFRQQDGPEKYRGR
jgi:hypothetical protein